MERHEISDEHAAVETLQDLEADPFDRISASSNFHSVDEAAQQVHAPRSDRVLPAHITAARRIIESRSSDYFDNVIEVLEKFKKSSKCRREH